MGKQKLGIRLEAFGLPLRRALQEAERLGVTGVQVDAVGDLSPKTLTQTGRREFRHLLRAHSLELTALGCPLRRGLDVAVDQQARIEHVRNVLTLSFDLGPRVVVAPLAQLPEDANHPRIQLLTEALLALGHHGDRTGAILALETGPDSGPTLRQFLDRFDTGGLGADLDPASLLANGFDPYEGARVLLGKVVHSHARDTQRTGAARSSQEVPLGHGDVDWMQYLSVLEEIEYRGWIVIDRQSGDNRAADVAAGVAFLRRFLAP